MNHPGYVLEDPAVQRFNRDLLVFSGVRLVLEEKDGQDDVKQLTTVFYKGNSVANLSEFAEGPIGMKDIRLIELPDKRVGVFTRPQGLAVGGPGQIGFTVLDSLSDINATNLDRAPVIPLMFPPTEWGGVNEAQMISNEWILAMGHRAYVSADRINPGEVALNRHYYPWMFALNYKTGDTINLGIVGEEREYPDGQARSPDLKDVFFPGGFRRMGNGLLTIYGGIRDAEAVVGETFDPSINLKIAA